MFASICLKRWNKGLDVTVQISFGTATSKF